MSAPDVRFKSRTIYFSTLPLRQIFFWTLSLFLDRKYVRRFVYLYFVYLYFLGVSAWLLEELQLSS